jgi:hypothetical protein
VALANFPGSVTTAFSDETEINVTVNEAEKVIVGNLVFYAEVIEQ